MPPVQTTYPDEMAPARPGQIASPAGVPRTRTRINASANRVKFGAVVMSTNVEKSCVLPGEAGAIRFDGITVIYNGVQPSNQPDTYAPKDLMTILDEGDIWVEVSVNVAVEDQAYFTPAGVITNVATSNTAIPNGYFATAGSAGGVAKLRIR